MTSRGVVVSLLHILPEVLTNQFYTSFVYIIIGGRTINLNLQFDAQIKDIAVP